MSEKKDCQNWQSGRTIKWKELDSSTGSNHHFHWRPLVEFGDSGLEQSHICDKIRRIVQIEIQLIKIWISMDYI